VFFRNRWGTAVAPQRMQTDSVSHIPWGPHEPYTILRSTGRDGQSIGVIESKGTPC
jgi:hypothetical protein